VQGRKKNLVYLKKQMGDEYVGGSVGKKKAGQGRGRKFGRKGTDPPCTLGGKGERAVQGVKLMKKLNRGWEKGDEGKNPKRD